MYKPTLKGKTIELRKSMIKFECDEYPLEIIRGSTFSQGYLNRQVILLTSCIGVPDEVFLNLLDEALKNLNINNVINGL